MLVSSNTLAIPEVQKDEKSSGSKPDDVEPCRSGPATSSVLAHLIMDVNRITRN